MSMPPLVSLLSDFGTRDGYVGAMKGSVLSHCPDARIIDVSHHVPPQDVRSGAFLLARAVRDLPPTTAHVAVVDPGVGSERRAVAARTAHGAWVVGPDNGLLGDAAAGGDLCVVLDPERVAPGTTPSATFHGRDLFAPAGARIARGDDPRGLGEETRPPQRLERPVRSADDGIEAEVVWIDRFGNAITLLEPADLEAMGDDVEIVVDSLVLRGLSRTYADVERGRPLAYWGSSGTLELGQREAHFADRTGIGRGSRIRVRPRAGS
ncbi:MAG TPA: SAM-dependent chlorinase/fluorinase [Candidatus Krumholzibacteria bacterium]|nr:SAM-dependent chlorinase/fluorinase [Candidatus Krumholzibacteria bacterium]